MNQIFEPGLLTTNVFDDFDQMASIATMEWDQRYRKLGREQDYGYAQKLNVPGAQITRIGWKTSLHIETGIPPGCIGFVQQVSGAGWTRFNGEALVENEIKVVHSPLQYDMVVPPGTTYLVLAVDGERVRRHQEAVCGDFSKKCGNNTRLISCSSAHSIQLAVTFSQYLDLAYQEPDSFSNPVAQEAMIEELLDTVYLTTESATPARSPVQRRKLARKAADFLHENVGELVTVRTMCEHVGVSERSLRQGFLERFGLTPKTYIKRYRLHLLHELLRASNPEGLSVSRAALSLGLTHFGRLSSEYYALFRELPSQTLTKFD
ncbi:MAG: helix-turn-helix domain-containing protein [Arenicellales bacterium]